MSKISIAWNSTLIQPRTNLTLQGPVLVLFLDEFPDGTIFERFSSKIFLNYDSSVFSFWVMKQRKSWDEFSLPWIDEIRSSEVLW